MKKKHYTVIVDDEGNMITDMGLLKHLIEVRTDLARRDGIPESRVLPDRGLVNISTYRPSSREEYVLLQGLSDGSFERYGETFLGEVRKYYGQEKVSAPPSVKD